MRFAEVIENSLEEIVMTRTPRHFAKSGSKRLAAGSAVSAIGLFILPVQMPVQMIPVAQAACEDWVLGPTVFAFTLDQNGLDFDTYGWSGKSVTALPSGAPAYATMWTDPKSVGPVTGNINGRTINMAVNWTEGAAKGTTSTFTGQIADDGTVKGTATGTPGGNTWTSDPTAKLPRCNAAAPKPEEKPAPPPEPPKDAITVSFVRTIPQWTVTVESKAPIPGQCVYNATSPGLAPVTVNFNIAANGSHSFAVLAPPPFTTWHVVTSCKGDFNGQQVEFGHDEQDVTLTT